MSPVWALHNEVIRGAVDPVRAHRRFVHYHRQKIESFTQINPKTTLNLFIPHQRGGLGFELPLGLPLRLTSFQRRFASFLFENYSSSVMKNVVPSPGSTGLVTRRALPSGIVSLFHNATLSLEPLIGPLNASVVEYLPRVYYPPALSQPVDLERPELIVRLPKTNEVRAFRSGKFPRMSTKDIMSWPYRLGERLLNQPGIDIPEVPPPTLDELLLQCAKMDPRFSVLPDPSNWDLNI